MKVFLLLIMMVPIVSLAQSSELVIAEETIAYDEAIETDTAIYYYNTDELVASEHGDVWLVYEDELVVIEAYDTTGDGEADTFVSLTTDGEVGEVTGAGAESLTRPEVVKFSDLIGGAGEASAAPDLVGDMSRIKGPNDGVGPYVPIGIGLLALLGAAFWWTRRSKQ